MNTGSLVDLITSVDVTSSYDFVTGPVVGLVNSLFAVVGNVIGLWPVGSADAAGSLQDILGSVSGT
ncbi:hypothetical protein RE943_38600 [Prescottella equi]|uniref:Uncharacterized protein n=1 Tax=Rhodococcus hoagii TaxID=43767 RepID=A0AAE4ZIQ1_RHOHA|nr:hypothetical protein [Prescottella equi]NKS27357.1 hypothetical protein [Prescottella equi]BCN70387.1 hypothetical protein RE943_38600 [Prescottella equi]